MTTDYSDLRKKAEAVRHVGLSLMQADAQTILALLDELESLRSQLQAEPAIAGKELPSLLSMKGCLKESMGGVSSVEYVRKLRNGDEEELRTALAAEQQAHAATKARLEAGRNQLAIQLAEAEDDRDTAMNLLCEAVLNPSNAMTNEKWLARAVTLTCP